MRTEAEVRELVEHYIAEYEGGHDPFLTEGWEPQDKYCLWCVRLRLLHWVLGDLDKPDNEDGVQTGWMYAWAGAMAELAPLKAQAELRSLHKPQGGQAHKHDAP